MPPSCVSSERSPSLELRGLNVAALGKPFLCLPFVPLVRVFPLPPLYSALSIPSFLSRNAGASVVLPEQGLLHDISTEFSSLTTASLSVLWILPSVPASSLPYFCSSFLFPMSFRFFFSSATVEIGFHYISQAGLELTIIGPD